VDSVELSMACSGPESAATLFTLRTHARLLFQAGRVDEGKAKLARVLATQTRVLGADHPETLVTRDDLNKVSAANSSATMRA